MVLSMRLIDVAVAVQGAFGRQSAEQKRRDDDESKESHMSAHDINQAGLGGVSTYVYHAFAPVALTPAAGCDGLVRRFQDERDTPSTEFVGAPIESESFRNNTKHLLAKE